MRAEYTPSGAWEIVPQLIAPRDPTTAALLLSNDSTVLEVQFEQEYVWQHLLASPYLHAGCACATLDRTGLGKMNVVKGTFNERKDHNMLWK